MTSTVGPSATVDVKRVKKVINDVVVSHYDDLTSLPMEAVPDLANRLFALQLVNNSVRGNPSEFKASLSLMRNLPQVQEHCQKFLSSFIAVRGSYADLRRRVCSAPLATPPINNLPKMSSRLPLLF